MRTFDTNCAGGMQSVGLGELEPLQVSFKGRLATPFNASTVAALSAVPAPISFLALPGAVPDFHKIDLVAHGAILHFVKECAVATLAYGSRVLARDAPQLQRFIHKSYHRCHLEADVVLRLSGFCST